jgi:adenylate cyclase
MAHSAAGRYEEAVEWSRRSIQRDREWYLPYLTLAVSCIRLGRVEEARAAAQELLRVRPNFSLAVVKLHTSGSEAASAQRNIDLLRSVGFPE